MSANPFPSGLDTQPGLRENGWRGPGSGLPTSERQAQIHAG